MDAILIVSGISQHIEIPNVRKRAVACHSCPGIPPKVIGEAEHAELSGVYRMSYGGVAG